MTRLMFLATTAVGITIGLTACNDTPVQPTRASAALADQGAAFSRGDDDRKGKKRGKALRCEDMLPVGSPGNALCGLPSILQAICTPGAPIPPVMLGPVTVTVTRTPTGLLITLSGAGIPVPIAIPVPLTPQQLAALCTINKNGQDCDDDSDGKRRDRD